MDAVTPELLDASQDPLGLGIELRPDGSPKGLKNWASIERVRNRVRNEIVPWLDEVRGRRATLDNRWSELTRVWTLEHDEKPYAGRSNIYMPSGKKVADTLTYQLTSATFPGEDYFGVDATRPEDAERSNLVRDALRQRLERDTHVRSKAELVYRQLVIKGNAPAKFTYRRKSLRTMRASRTDPFSTPEHVLYDGPVFEPVDANTLYVWPETADSLEEAMLVFQDMTLPLSLLRQRARDGIYDKGAVERATAGAVSSAAIAEQNRLQSQGIPDVSDSGKYAGHSMVDVTEVYLEFDPSAATANEEVNPLPFLITVTGTGEVLRVIRNPFWHQQPPFAWGRMGLLPGRFYGTGFLDAVRELNILLNAHVNQGMDGATWALNRGVLYNPNLIQGDMPNMSPGMAIPVNDVNAAFREFGPGLEVINAVSNLATQAMAWIQDHGGAPPVLQGGSSPGRAFRTATGVGTAQRNASIPIQEIVKRMEDEVWKPTLYFFFMLDQQFAPDAFFARYARQGEVPMRYGPQDLEGDWRFQWRASDQTDNKAVKGQQLLQLIQLLSSPAIAAVLQANGLSFNPSPLIRQLYTQVYGMRDIDEVLLKQAVQSVMPGMPGATGGAPGMAPGALNGENPSLVDNAEFTRMREGANAEAGAMGVANTPAMG